MARTLAQLPKGTRITDYMSLGILTKTFPLREVNAALAAQGRASHRQRELPAQVVVYDVIALALFMQVSYREVLRCLLEGLAWLLGPRQRVKITGKSGIWQARSRLGWEVMQQLHDKGVKPLAVERTKGAWYRHWRLATLDGSTLEVADERENGQAFGRPGASRGASAYPQIRFVSLVENGTHVLLGTRMADYATGEVTLAQEVISALRPEMLCLADRNFFGFTLWNRARATEANLLWRAETLLPDGSYLSRIYRSERDWRHRSNGVVVRVIDYRLEGIAGAEPIDRLLTTILDPAKAPAGELAALYHERWEIETALDESKTHLRGAKIVLRSKTPDLVRQEFYGLLLAHFAVRGLMHEAALDAGEDPTGFLLSMPPGSFVASCPWMRLFPPLGPRRCSMKRCWRKSGRNGSSQAEVAATHAG